MKKALTFLYILTFAALVGLLADNVMADPPNVLNNTLQYSRVGSPVFGHSHTAPTGTGLSGFVGDDADFVTDAVADAHLFEWGTIVTISCVTQASFCWVMDQDETTMAVDGTVTDTDAAVGGGNDGVGSCFRVEAGLYKDVTVFRDNFRASAKVGRREGYCTVNTTTLDWPCDADADCSTSGVCVRTAPAFDKIKGAFLLSRAASAASCFITEEK